jgi:hypothetical protein
MFAHAPIIFLTPLILVKVIQVSKDKITLPIDLLKEVSDYFFI